MTEPVITDNASARRFETRVEGALCVLEYRVQGDVMHIDHVAVPAAVGGRGIAASLSRAALEAARDRGWRVMVHCPYVAAYLRRHREFAELVVS